MQQQFNIYIAGPIFTPGDRYEAECINQVLGSELEHFSKYVLKKEADVIFDIFMPHRDGGVLGQTMFEPEAIYDLDWAKIKNASLVIANLNGAEVDAGTAVEIGMAHALGIPVILYRNDARTREIMNLMLTKGNVLPIAENTITLAKHIHDFIQRYIDSVYNACL